MSRSPVGFFILILLGATASNAPSAEPNWAGEYADKNFLRGQAAFQMTIEQSGNSIEVSFDTAYIDAHGAAPDGGGQARIPGKNALQATGKIGLASLDRAQCAKLATGLCRR